MMQFVIILYEAVIIYDHEARRGTARRCAVSGRVSYTARHENYLISNAVDKPSKTIAKNIIAPPPSSVIAIVETRDCDVLISSQLDNSLAFPVALAFASYTREEEVRIGRLRETRVLRTWNR